MIYILCLFNVVANITRVNISDVPDADVFSKSDPYVVFKIGETELFRTVHIQNANQCKFEGKSLGDGKLT